MRDQFDQAVSCDAPEAVRAYDHAFGVEHCVGSRCVLTHANQALMLQNGQVVLQGAAHEVAGNPALSNYLGV
jgi:ABC-type branched-subunit amino acid transport system ATPase component